MAAWQYMQNHPEARRRVQQYMQDNPQARQAVQRRMAQAGEMRPQMQPQMCAQCMGQANPIEQAYRRGVQDGLRIAMEQAAKMHTQGKGGENKAAGCEKMDGACNKKQAGAMKPAGKGKNAMAAKGDCDKAEGDCEKQAGAMKPAGKGKNAMAAKGDCDKAEDDCEKQAGAMKPAGKGKNAMAAKGDCEKQEQVIDGSKDNGAGKQRRRGHGGNGSGNHEGRAGFSDNISDDDITASLPVENDVFAKCGGGKGSGSGNGSGEQKRLKKKDGSGTCQDTTVA
jgi:hypothetical protein